MHESQTQPQPPQTTTIHPPNTHTHSVMQYSSYPSPLPPIYPYMMAPPCYPPQPYQGFPNPQPQLNPTPTQSASPQPPQANHLLSSSHNPATSDGSWFPDSGATNHLTNAQPFQNMTSPYSGPGKVLVGNGSTLDISAIGSSTLPSTGKPLLLNNLLYTPAVTKNLLSVSQFSKDNQVYFEFHPSHCLIKDSLSNKVLLKGYESGGLYRLDFSSFRSKSNNLVESATVSPDQCLNLSTEFQSFCNNAVLSAQNSAFPVISMTILLHVMFIMVPLFLFLLIMMMSLMILLLSPVLIVHPLMHYLILK